MRCLKNKLHQFSNRLFQRKSNRKNDFGHLYYMICEEQIAPVGTFLESDLLAPVKNLPEAEQAEIYAIYG